MGQKQVKMGKTGKEELSSYMRAARNLGRGSMVVTKPAKSVRVALLPSFTLRGLGETLRVKGAQEGIEVMVYDGGYQQYAQEILQVESGLHRFAPQLVFLCLDTRSLAGEVWWSRSAAERRAWVKEQRARLGELVEQLAARTKAKIVINTLVVPTLSPYGILEAKQPFGWLEAVGRLNSELREMAKRDEQLWLFDYDAFCSRLGKERVFDERLYYLGDVQLHPKFVPNLADEYLAYVRPLVGLVRKCLVVDLDNTLWGGVLGEDGLEGIRLGPTPAGRPFWELQKYILSLWQRGVVLAVNSKNNEAEVHVAFARHPYMVIKESHIAAWRINWDDKVTNMQRLSAELDLGLDSFVFLDDDPAQRAQVRAALPEVAVVEVPDDPARYLAALASRHYFDSYQLTDEDSRRGEMYVAQRRRRELQSAVVDLTEYLRRLEMVVTISLAGETTMARVAQLTQKTNQFNMTTRRYQEEDIRRWLHSGHLVATVSVRDMYGESGLTGLAIIVREKAVWRIDTLLLSCRVIGRRVEDVLLAYLVEAAQAAGVKKLVGEFINSGRNEAACGHYERCGFSLTDRQGEVERWEFPVSRGYAYPDFIRVIKHEGPDE
ncbi:MAG: HAD-IIIC family phosphatase [Candidatus Andersenbacteria bacterium]|nr:HAD-IIIC family phosphatase [Candidatus Andersenbacteria bacterium]